MRSTTIMKNISVVHSKGTLTHQTANNMKLNIAIVILGIMFFALSPALYAQGQTALPFLLIPSSPEGNGMGGISGTTITESPLATLANPAQLGIMSLDHHFAVGFYPSSTDWLAGIPKSGFTYSATAFNAGISINKLTPLPFGLSVGIGYSHVSFNLGSYNVTVNDPSVVSMYSAEDHSENWSLGVGIDYYIRLGLGYTTKGISSNLAPFDVQGQGRQGIASTSAYDLGIIASIPVAGIVNKVSDTPITILGKYQPLLDISFASAWSNLGDHKVPYIDAAQADPLPRNAMLGLSYKAGFTVPLPTTSWEVFSFTLAREAEDILVERFPAVVDSNYVVIDPGAPPQYKSGTGAIQFFNNVVLGEGNTRVTLRKGWQLNLGEILSLRGGSVNGSSESYATDGWGLRLGGLLKLIDQAIPSFADSPFPMFILHHIDLRYDHASSTYDDPDNLNDGVTFNSVSVIVK
jgi:hypothetical protein